MEEEFFQDLAPVSIALQPSRFNPSVSVPRTSFHVIEGVSWAIVGAFALILIFNLLSCFFVKPLADDYSFAMMAKQHGFWGSEYYWWHGYVGRWMAIFLCNCAVSFNFLLYPLAPIGTLILWLVGLYKAILTLIEDRLTAIAFSSILLGCTFSLLPNAFESLFWVAALFVHTWPLALSALAMQVFLKKEVSLWCVAPLFFCLSGCSETFDLAIAPVLILIALWRRDKIAVVAALCFLTGMAMMVLAPGNAVRMAEFSGHDRSVAHVLERSWETGSILWNRDVSSVLFYGAIAIFVLGISLNTRWRPKWFVPLVGIAFSFYSAVITQFPSFYGTGHLPDARTQIASAYFVSAGILFAALTMSFVVRPYAQRIVASPSRIFTAAILLLLICGGQELLPAVGNALSGLNTMHQFARLWKERDSSIRSQMRSGAKIVRVDRINLISVDIRAEPNYYVNDFMTYNYDPTRRVKIVAKP